MKSVKMFFGIASLTLAFIAVLIAITSNQPNAWFGYVLGVGLASKGIVQILESTSTEDSGRRE